MTYPGARTAEADRNVVDLDHPRLSRLRVGPVTPLIWPAMPRGAVMMAWINATLKMMWAVLPPMPILLKKARITR